jgi:hypothetical protein
MNAMENTFQVPGHVLTGFTHPVSEDLIDKANETADYGNIAAQKGKVSKEMKQGINARLNHLTEN